MGRRNHARSIAARPGRTIESMKHIILRQLWAKYMQKRMKIISAEWHVGAPEKLHFEPRIVVSQKIKK